MTEIEREKDRERVMEELTGQVVVNSILRFFTNSFQGIKRKDVKELYNQSNEHVHKLCLSLQS